MLIVPLQAIPAQTLSVTLANQSIGMTLRQRSTGLFIDLSFNNSTALLPCGVICQDRNRIIRDAYWGFVGDLAFFDTQGTDDPYYTGLGSRYLLAYLEASDLAAMGLSG